MSLKEQLQILQNDQTCLREQNKELTILLKETRGDPNLSGHVKTKICEVRGEMMRNRLGKNGLRRLNNKLRDSRKG